MKRWLCLLLICATVPALSENYLLNGGQESRIRYEMVQTLVPVRGTKDLILSYVIPKSFRSPSYNQEIQDFQMQFSLKPHSEEKWTDPRGNDIVRVKWNSPSRSVQARLRFIAVNRTILTSLSTDAPFPLKSFPANVGMYLTSTKQVPANNPHVKRIASILTRSAETEFDAVQKILTWIIDHMHYVLRPESYDAVYSIRTGKGNCQNYSHVAASLMRAVGIPVRIVNGVTLREPYHIRLRGGTLTQRMAQGRHSWIEVWFPDLGWVPFDPQQMQMFVSNRFIRVEVGLDNHDAVNDGTVMWTRERGSRAVPRFNEKIDVDFDRDRVDLAAVMQRYGPRKMLFTPPVEAAFVETAVEHSSAAPRSVSATDLKSLSFNRPYIHGNLEFPENYDFLEPSPVVEAAEGGALRFERQYVVETSEYVTTQGQRYAQAFILEDPILLEKAGLSLHAFGGSGQLWIELLDDAGGKPGNTVATSEIKPLSSIHAGAGYQWEDFDFSDQSLKISPGRYWLALAYTGSPIVSWFFTYGKPTGPPHGTRYNTMFDETWSHSLTYEFNYRVVGRIGE